MMLFEELLRVLACPRCKELLSLDEAGADDGGAETSGSGTLSCAGCALAYPIRDGVAELLASEASPWVKSGH
ncbi:Trm112 family protein [Cystobacter fuscus]|uniref:Trm112 family protein n=1 Tax=Cystobacter fuscus TaxID=43 RepID=UPI002B2B2526|nr:Trm112 family protein [Cystobacter fuscus]